MKTIKRFTLLTLLLAVVVIVSSKKGHAQDANKDRPRIKYISINGSDTTIIDKYVDELTDAEKAKMKFKEKDFADHEKFRKQHMEIKKEHENFQKEHEKMMKEHNEMMKGMEEQRTMIIKGYGDKDNEGRYRYMMICNDSLGKGKKFSFKMDSNIVIINGKELVMPPLPPMPPMGSGDFNFTVPPVPPVPPIPGFDGMNYNDVNVTVEENEDGSTKKVIIEMKKTKEEGMKKEEGGKKKEETIKKKKSATKSPDIPSSSLKENMESTSTDMKIYPNPSSGLFNLAFEIKEKGEINVRVTDITGKEIYKENFTDTNGGYYHHSFDLKDEPDGIYIIIVEQNGKKEVMRFVKES
jgi:hypothetical protein